MGQVELLNTYFSLVLSISMRSKQMWTLLNSSIQTDILLLCAYPLGWFENHTLRPRAREHDSLPIHYHLWSYLPSWRSLQNLSMIIIMAKIYQKRTQKNRPYKNVRRVGTKEKFLITRNWVLFNHKGK